jgi:hypothetical protein
MKKQKLNLNKLAKLITDIEGKKTQVNIAQVKEILKIMIELQAQYIEVYQVMNEAILKQAKKK